MYFNRRGYKGKTSKLIQRWTGIYIVKAINETNADIQLFDEPDRPPTRVHLNNLKLYHGLIVRGDGTDVVIEFDIDSQPDEPPESGTMNCLLHRTMVLLMKALLPLLHIRML